MKNWIVLAVGAGITLLGYLLSFFHCVIKTQNHYIFCYSCFFIIRKADSLVIKASTDSEGYNCAQYFIGNKRPLYLYTGTSQRAKSKAESKDKTDYATLFENIKRNTIIVEPTKTKSFNKIGGTPDLPKDFEWPMYQNDCETIMACGIKNRPLSFLMQVDFADLKKYDTEELLPENGVLSIFYDNLSQPLGENEHQQNGLKAYYFEAGIKLEPFCKEYPQNEWDSDGEYYIDKQFIKFHKRYSLPYADEYELLTKKKYPKYSEALDTSEYNKATDTTRFLGYAESIQGPAISCINQIKPTADLNDYILLLQITSNYDTPKSFSLADNGTIYIYIHKQDLKQRNFDNMIYTVQFY